MAIHTNQYASPRVFGPENEIEQVLIKLGISEKEAKEAIANAREIIGRSVKITLARSGDLSQVLDYGTTTRAENKTIEVTINVPAGEVSLWKTSNYNEFGLGKW